MSEKKKIKRNPKLSGNKVFFFVLMWSTTFFEPLNTFNVITKFYFYFLCDKLSNILVKN